MRRTFLYVLMTLALVATATTAPRAQGGTQTLVAYLTGGGETPAVNTGAYGKATITINPGTGEVSWVVDVFNLPTGLIASHIHVGSANLSGPVMINFAPTNLTQSGPFRFTGSTTNFVALADKGIRSMQEAMIAIASGNTYVNVHTQANPGGEIRGQLCPAKGSDNGFNGIALCTPQAQ